MITKALPIQVPAFLQGNPMIQLRQILQVGVATFDKISCWSCRKGSFKRMHRDYSRIFEPKFQIFQTCWWMRFHPCDLINCEFTIFPFFPHGCAHDVPMNFLLIHRTTPTSRTSLKCTSSTGACVGCHKTYCWWTKKPATISWYCMVKIPKLIWFYRVFAPTGPVCPSTLCFDKDCFSKPKWRLDILFKAFMDQKEATCVGLLVQGLRPNATPTPTIL